MNIDLLHYVEEARKSGMTDGQIRQGLLQSGWAANDIEEAMIQAPAAGAAPARPKMMLSGKKLVSMLIYVAVAAAAYFAVAYYMANYQDFSLWPF